MKKAILVLLLTAILSTGSQAQNALPEDQPPNGRALSESGNAQVEKKIAERPPPNRPQAVRAENQADRLRQSQALDHSRMQAEAANKAVWIAAFGLLVAFVQAVLFVWQLMELKKATQAAKDAAQAAHRALIANNPPDIRITNAQIWPADGQKGDTVDLSPGSRYRIRIHAVNIGQSSASLCKDEPNAAMAYFLSGRKHLPMFRPFKPESPEYAKENTHALKHPDGISVSTSLEPGKFGFWEFETHVPESDGGNTSLYAIGLIGYWSLVDGRPSRRRITGFAFRFEKDAQRFVQVSHEEEPNYQYIE